MLTTSRPTPLGYVSAALIGAGLLLSAGGASAQAGDAASGAKLFMQCSACHTATPGGANGVGPNLSGVYGSKAASHAGYSYSDALKSKGLTWTPANLDKWLTKPSAMVPGTKMTFFGLSSPKARADVIAYLASLKH